MTVTRSNNPLQATRRSGHLVFNRLARRAPERERYTDPSHDEKETKTC